MPKPPRAAREPLFFDDAAAFRRWLETNHTTETELLLGFLKKRPGRTSLTYFEAVDEALCFGWIDGVKRSLDDDRYCQRFSPRTARSVWSLVNIRKVEALNAAGRMAPAGLKAFEARHAKRTGIYSFEQRRSIDFDRASVRAFRSNAAAWAFWSAQPPGYRRTATFWVMGAKKAETRQRRLRRLIGDSAKGRRLDERYRPEKKSGAAPSKRP